jgi:hypothetical protein
MSVAVDRKIRVAAGRLATDAQGLLNEVRVLRHSRRCTRDSRSNKRLLPMSMMRRREFRCRIAAYDVCNDCTRQHCALACWASLLALRLPPPVSSVCFKLGVRVIGNRTAMIVRDDV